ncbi:MAG: hypothetical protein JO242_13140, partial [Streptosporangiaceae bacterium]|nr:hypothetical protein [Streptosporangiaceae bacterium]
MAGAVSVGLVVVAASASHLFSAHTAAATAPAVNMNCTLIVPANPLTAQGLASPYQLTATNPAAGPCNEANPNQTAFVQGAVINPATGQISVYNPLVIDKGTQPAQQPVMPALPAGGIVAVWFGFNGNTLTLQGADQAGITGPTPTGSPTAAPTTAPSGPASATPTTAPTTAPTVTPTTAPSGTPTATPTATPTPSPTWTPGGNGWWYYYFYWHHHRYLHWRHHRHHGHGWRYGTVPAGRSSGGNGSAAGTVGGPAGAASGPAGAAGGPAGAAGGPAGTPTTPPANANVPAASATPDAILQQANCIAGESIQGQFSSFTQVGSCNGLAFFHAANDAIQEGKLTVPSPGTALDGQPCPTTRDFSVIDQDQSDNVTTEYLANGNGQTAQDTAGNQQALAGAATLFNGSDNGLIDLFVDP